VTEHTFELEVCAYETVNLPGLGVVEWLFCEGRLNHDTARFEPGEWSVMVAFEAPPVKVTADVAFQVMGAYYNAETFARVKADFGALVYAEWLDGVESERAEAGHDAWDRTVC
jgi:hypothetical protein